MDSLFATVQPWLVLLGVFAIIALSSRQLGLHLSRYKLPLISGYLIAGIIVGPFLLNLVTSEAVAQLRFIDDIALAYIAFSAGNELLLKTIRQRLATISWITIGIVAASVAATFFFFSLFGDAIPFAAGLPEAEMLAITLASLAVVASLSPAGTLAVIAELRAKGPLTKTAIGVSVVADVVVIVGFAICISLASNLLSGESLEALTFIYLAGEIGVSLLLGYLLGRLVALAMRLHAPPWLKTAALLLAGYLTFAGAHALAEWSEHTLGHAIHLESLLICLVASFYVTNYTPFRAELTHLIEEVGPLVYLAFFTLTGAALELDILGSVLLLAGGLVLLRLVAVLIGASAGSLVAREPLQRTAVGWMSYVTQAGVGLGLAKSLGGTFSTWGSELASLLIGSIIINQLIGPPLFKVALERLGETHTKRKAAGEISARSILIFGVEDQSIALARELQAESWQVRLVDVSDRTKAKTDLVNGDFDILNLPEITPATLKQTDIRHTGVMLSMFTDDELNYKVCEIAYEHFGVPRMIVRLNDSSAENVGRFDELGVRIVNPQTAMLSLLNQFVRSPEATSLLLGLETAQRVADVTVSNSELDGVPLRELNLPSDVLILALRRQGELLITHGYSQIAVNDTLSVIGSPDSLEKVRLLLR